MLTNTESNRTRRDDFSQVCGSCNRLCCKEAWTPVSSERRRVIEDHLSRAAIPVERPFDDDGYAHPRETSDGCIFLDIRTKRCTIQSVKPELCVAYPVTFDINFTSGTIEWYLHTAEVCPLSGVLSRDDVSFTRHLESAKREIQAFIRGLPTAELFTVLAIEVPEAVKIGADPLPSNVLKRLDREYHFNLAK